MASKVNTKFVVILGASVVAGLGLLVGAGYVLLYNTPEDLVRKGDAAMARKDYVEAAAYFAKACDKDKSDPENFRRWRESIEAQTPDTPSKMDTMLQSWRGATRMLAVTRRTDVAAKREYLETLKPVLIGPFDRTGLTYVKTECDNLLAPFAGQPSGEWEGLRKYRGLALMRMALQSPEAKQADWDAAIEDLEAALRASPGDYECTMALEGIAQELAARARSAAQTEQAATWEARANAIIADYTAKNPDDPMMMLATLRRDVNLAAESFQKQVREARERGLPMPDPLEASNRFVGPAKERLDAAFQAAKAKGGGAITLTLVGLMKAMERDIDRPARLARTEELIRMALEAQPEDLDLLGARAEVYAERNEFATAIEHLNRIIELPPRKVGPDGSKLFAYRNNARYLQALWAYRDYVFAVSATAEERAAMLDRAKTRREALLKTQDASSVPALLIEAWHLYATGDIPGADRQLNMLDRRSRITDGDTLVLWAQVAMQKNEPGSARERLLSVLRVQPDNLAAGLAFGQLSISLQDYDAAREMYESILRLAPDLKQAQDGLQAANAGLGKGTLADPVQQVILDSIRVQREGAGKPGTEATVNTMLTEAVAKYGPQPRLIQALVSARLNLGDHDGALEYVRTALAKAPQDRLLLDLQTWLTTADPIDAALMIIDARPDVPEMSRLIAKFTTLRGKPGRERQVEDVLAQLVAKYPDEEQVIEIQFLEAAQARDWDKATIQADRAAKLNIDKADGRTFRARLLAQRGDTRGAIDLMQQVIDAGVRTPEVYRLMGRLLAGVGRGPDAVNAYREALRLRPNDAGAIKDLMTALAMQGQRDQALIVARDGERHAGSDPEFLDLWLKFESEFGNLPMVIARRERMAVAAPKDRENLYELGRLYVRTGELTKARPIIDRVRALGDDFDAVSLDASWYWARGDRVAADRVFAEYVARQSDNKAKLAAHMDYARFLQARGERTLTLAVLEAAQAYQDPATREADKALSEALFSDGNHEQAVRVLTTLLDANADTPDAGYRKRLVEALIRLKRLDEAQTALAVLTGGKDPDMVSMLLEADLREAQGREAEQRQILERVVAKFPGEAAPYLKRGQALMKNEATRRAAEADFSKAIQVQPSMWQAYRLRAALRGQMKDPEGALVDLQEALRLNPGDDEMLVSLVMDLLGLNRDQQAEDVAREALKGRPRESQVYTKLGNLFAQLGRPAIASRFFEDSYNLSPHPAVAQRLLDSLLAPSAPDLAKADAFLRRLGDEVNKYPGALMAMAKVRVMQQRPQEGVRAATEAMKLLDPGNAGIMLAWHADMDQIIKEPANYLRFLDQTIKMGVAPVLNEWLMFFYCEVQTRAKEAQEPAIAGLTKLLTDSRNAPVRQFAHRLRGTAAYTLGKTADAERYWSEGVKEFPEDPEMNNNLAYLLAQRGEYAAAKPLAEASARLSPTSADAWDTLGYVLMHLGELGDAEKAFRRALVQARTVRQNLMTGIHLTETLYRLGRTGDAQNLFADVRKLADNQASALDAESRKELQHVEELLKKPQ
ncbi:MAG: hypothetical protein HBSAPP03_10460 [Phycisphaerae bacterium]|nr:MAG: hypothetical protein HBSAPP03_10460 [Phycisphaerae bacterium]